MDLGSASPLRPHRCPTKCLAYRSSLSVWAISVARLWAKPCCATLLRSVGSTSSLIVQALLDIMSAKILTTGLSHYIYFSGFFLLTRTLSTVSTCRKHKVKINHAARQVSREDFTTFTHILASDQSNLSNLQRVTPKGSTAEVRLWGAYDDGKPIADPYYGGMVSLLGPFRMQEYQTLQSTFRTALKRFISNACVTRTHSSTRLWGRSLIRSCDNVWYIAGNTGIHFFCSMWLGVLRH